MEEVFFGCLGILAAGVVVVCPIVCLVMLSKVKGGVQSQEQSLRVVREELREIRRSLHRQEPTITTADAGKGAEEKQTEDVVVTTPLAKVDVKPPVATMESSLDVAPPPLPHVESKAPATESPEPVDVVAPAPAAPEKPRTAAEERASRFAESAQDVLGKIWKWILVGDRPEGVTAEYAIATTWLLRLGVLAIVGCISYFLKWSFSQGLIGPEGRVAISLLAGIAMVVIGLRLLGKKYHLIGQGLLGGGLLSMYFSVWSAGARYDLIPISLAFVLMLAVTVTAGLLAVRSDSQLIAILGIVGGYITPVALSTGEGNLPILYSYMLLLGLGILGVALYRNWRLLNYLGFICTYTLFGLSLVERYEQADFWLAIGFLSAYFVLHASLVYIYNIMREQKSTTLEIIHLCLNAVLFAALGYGLIEDAYGRPYPALLALGLAAFFIVHVVIFLRKRLVDRILLVTLVALAGASTVWTLPLIWEKESLTIAFALVALTFLWIGNRLQSNFIVNLSYLLYGVVFFRLVLLDVPENFGSGYVKTDTFTLYLSDLWDRLMNFGVAIGAVVAGFFVQRRDRMVSGGAVGTSNDTGAVVPAASASTAFYWFAVLFAFLFLHLELNAMFQFVIDWRPTALTLLWCAMGAYFLWMYLRSGRVSASMLVAFMVFSGLAILKLLSYDVATWHCNDSLVYHMEYNGLYALTRGVDFGALIVLLGAGWWLCGVRQSQTARSLVFGYSGLALLLVYSTLEINTLTYWKLREFQDGAISVLWVLFAVSFVAGGIWKNVRSLRFVGLALFSIVVLKVVIHDLSGMPVVYKVVAFLIVGLALMLGSFVYIFANRKFEAAGESTDKALEGGRE